MPNKVLTNEGRNAVRDALQADLADMAVGTDGSDAEVTETALGNEVIRKAFREESDAAIGAGLYTMRLLSTEANNNDLAEIGLFTGAGAMYARLVFASVAKTSDFEIQFEVTAEVKNP